MHAITHRLKSTNGAPSCCKFLLPGMVQRRINRTIMCASKTNLKGPRAKSAIIQSVYLLDWINTVFEWWNLYFRDIYWPIALCISNTMRTLWQRVNPCMYMQWQTVPICNYSLPILASVCYTRFVIAFNWPVIVNLIWPCFVVSFSYAVQELWLHKVYWYKKIYYEQRLVDWLILKMKRKVVIDHGYYIDIDEVLNYILTFCLKCDKKYCRIEEF